MSQVNNGQVNDTALQYRRVAGTATGFRGLIKNFRVFAITCFACIGGLLYGYNQGVFSGILTMPSFAAHMGDYVTNSIKKGWLTSILELGAWIRAIYSGFLAEAFSRKYAIILSTSIFIIGVVIQATAIRVGPQAILGSRFVTGMGIGSLSVVVPIYVAECAPPESRGLLLGVQQFAIEFGVMISFWLPVSDRSDVQESCGRYSDDVLFPVAGINAILYYAPNIFGALGMSSNTTSLLATGVIGIVMLVATIPTLIWIDKIGRKPILTLGALGMAFCHLAIAVIFARNESNWASQQASAWACVVLVWVYVAFFGWSWGPCEWILVAEIWPLSARPYGVAIATSTNWMNNFIVGQVTPDLIANIRYGTFIIFGILIAVDGGFIFFFTPETSKLTLEEMDLVFGSSGVAAADNERMLTINREIGLDQTVNELLRRASVAEKETSVEEREHAEPVEVK